MLTMPETDGKALVKTLNDFPPITWLYNDCKTTDQKAHWAEVKKFNQFVKTLLDNYFAGKSSPALDAMQLKDKQFWINFTDSYLRLYDLVRYCWHSISADATLNGFENFPSSPGEMLVRIVEFETAQQLWDCTEYASPKVAKFSPCNAYKQLEPKTKTIADLRSLPKEDLWFNAYRRFCLLACHRDSKRDSLLKKKLKQFLVLEAEITAELRSMAHPSQRLQGYQWVNGVKQPLKRG